MAYTFKTRMSAAKGTMLHEYATQAILLGIKQADTGQTLNTYINDAIGFRMRPEQVLMVSPNAFGTADAISFRRNMLRIHDLKTGITPASMNQLMIYAAFFCLEYEVKPNEIDIELRIYQNDAVQSLVPDVDDIFHIIDKTVSFDRVIQNLKTEEF